MNRQPIITAHLLRKLIEWKQGVGVGLSLPLQHSRCKLIVKYANFLQNCLMVRLPPALGFAQSHSKIYGGR